MEREGSMYCCGLTRPAPYPWPSIYYAPTQVSLALSKAVEAQEASYKASLEGKSAQQMLCDLDEQIAAVYNPPPPEPAEGDEAGQPDAAPAPEAEPSAAEGDGGAEDAAPPADSEPGDGDAPPDPVAALSGEVAALRAEHTASSAARDASRRALDLATAALGCVGKCVSGVAVDALKGLRNATAVPQGTFHVVKVGLASRLLLPIPGRKRV